MQQGPSSAAGAEQCTYHCLPSVAQTTDNNSAPVAYAVLRELLGLCGCPNNQQASTHRSLHRIESHRTVSKLKSRNRALLLVG